MGSNFFDYLAEAVSRRTVLKKLVQGAGAVGLGILGIQEAKALVAYLCCNLCKNPGSCTYGNCTCEWCWTCSHTDGCTYSCDECYSASGAWCNNRTQAGCSTAGSGDLCPAANTCSRARQIYCPPPPPPPPFGCFWPCTTPIILDVGGQGFHLTDADHGVLFDIRGNGQPVQIAWTAPGVNNGFLALPGPDGVIHNGLQLFGNFTPQPASDDPNGFRALAIYDEPANGGNGDGVIDSQDAVFSSLGVWIDANHDGICQSEELHTLQSLGIDSIDLRYHLSRRRDEYGNVFRYRAAVNRQDPDGLGTNHRVYDVILRHK